MVNLAIKPCMHCTRMCFDHCEVQWAVFIVLHRQGFLTCVKTFLNFIWIFFSCMIMMGIIGKKNILKNIFFQKKEWALHCVHYGSQIFCHLWKKTYMHNKAPSKSIINFWWAHYAKDLKMWKKMVCSTWGWRCYQSKGACILITPKGFIECKIYANFLNLKFNIIFIY
jgi:hypothetical protein